MEPWTDNSLTWLGAKRTLDRFERQAQWLKRLNGRFSQLYENSPDRRTWWFETRSEPPLEELVALSQEWPSITFLLKYENQLGRFLGIAVVRQGKIDPCRINYRL